jgi:hypothetical protein
LQEEEEEEEGDTVARLREQRQRSAAGRTHNEISNVNFLTTVDF